MNDKTFFLTASDIHHIAGTKAEIVQHLSCEIDALLARAEGETPNLKLHYALSLSSVKYAPSDCLPSQTSA